MENKKNSFPKALIIVISVISLIAMLSLSAFAAAPNGYSNSGFNYKWENGYDCYVYCTSFTYNGTNYTADYINNGKTCIKVYYSEGGSFYLKYSNGNDISLDAASTIYCTCITDADNVYYYNFEGGTSYTKSVLDNYYCTLSSGTWSVYMAIDVAEPDPLEKTYPFQFYNNSTYFSSIKISGTSTDQTNFASISTIKYGNTIVYDNDAWVTGYSSVLNYTSDVAPSLTTINSEANGIVTFTSQYQEPDMWDSVFTAVPTLLDNIGSTATSIVNNEYLALFCLVLPLISLAVGLLIRMRDRT